MSIREDAVTRIAWQYQDSPKLLGLVLAIVHEFDKMNEVLQDLKTRLSIDDSEGLQLDRIGYILGQERPMVTGAQGAQQPDGFSFLGGIGFGFSGLGRPDVGGRFIGLEGGWDGRMLDPDYRVLLKATAFRNHCGASLQDMADFSMFVFSAPVTIKNYVGRVDVLIHKALRPWERRLVFEIIPRAAGIRIEMPLITTGQRPFAFAGNTQASGFGGIYIEQDGAGFVGLF
jgi:hypothetical protein